MRFLKILSLGLATSIAFNIAYTQSSGNPYKEVSIASPTAASLGKYGDIPVNNHTGIPQVGIPIYTVSEGPLSLPISLSYFAGGLKVMEPSSWVGANWSLNAGGVITRTVQGGPDEKATSGSGNQTWGYFSEYGYNNYLYANNGGQQDWERTSKGEKDGEPDLFFFNFNGFSGKFYFRDDRTPVLVPQMDVKIVPTYSGTGSIQAFTITSNDGVKYFFGNIGTITGAVPVEITNPYSSQNGLGTGTAISSWYLKRVESEDGLFAINLTYTQENYGYHTISMFPVDDNLTPEYSLIKNIITGVRLSQITCSNGTVSFIPGAVRTDLSDNAAVMFDNINVNAKTLDTIKISNTNGDCKRFKFSYGYFTDNTTGISTYLASYSANLQTDKKRLRLDTLQELSCNNLTTIPPHIFTYFTEFVPRRLSFGMDHWGFYNGVNTNDKLVPTYKTIDGPTMTTITGANRDAAWPAMRGGALQQIDYPTGGNTVFDFEANNKYYSYAQPQSFTRVTLSLGFSGGNTSLQILPFTVTGNRCNITLSNILCPWDATLKIKNSGGTVVQQLNAPAFGAQQQVSINLAAGNYTGELSIANGGNATPSGQGSTASVNELVNVVVSGNRTVGGLRIKTITNYDGISTANNVVKSFGYEENGVSSGVLYSRPVYVQQVRNDLIKTVGYWKPGTGPGTGFQPNSTNPDGCPGLGGYLRSGGSIRPMASVQGNHIGYSKVKVSQINNGYSIFNYYINNTGGFGGGNNTDDVAVTTITVGLICDPAAPNYPAAPLPFDYKRGELQSELHYNNTGQILKDVYYYPEYDAASAFSTPAFKVEARTTAPGTTILLGTYYSLSSPRRVKTRTQETNYSQTTGNAATTTIVYYSSPFHNEASQTDFIKANGDTLTTRAKYMFDFRVATADVVSDCSPEFTTATNTCLSQYNTTVAACTTNTCISDAYLAYLLCGTNARNSYITCRQTNAVTINTAFQSAKTAADIELKPILERRDIYNNAPVEITKWRNGNLLEANYYRYEIVANPANKVYLNKAQQINLATPSASFTPSSVATTTVSKDSRYLDESFYKYANGNISEMTPKSGVTMTYIWGHQNNYPIAKVTNALQTEIAYTSFEANATGNWTIGSTARNTTATNIITGKQAYSLSGGQITKAGLTAGKQYVVTYYTTSAIAATVSANGVGIAGTLLFTTANSKRCYQHILPATATSVAVSGTIVIDELRLHPKDAQMMSYTYNPLVGMTSSNSNNNIISLFEYDGLLRMKLARDMDGRILKKNEYQYQQNTSQ
jgi:hypothetical protein